MQKNQPAARRKKILFPHGYQIKFTGLVIGSLTVLLIFAGFHGVFIAEQALTPEEFTRFEPQLLESTLRLIVVGIIYISILALAAIFLSHRMMGPTVRLEEQIREMVDHDNIHTLKIRAGDDLEGLIDAMDKLIRKLKS